MREARIDCLCSEITIEDIRVRFRRDDVAWLSEARVEKSNDLKHALERGALRLRWVERCRTEKAPEPGKKVIVLPTVPKPVFTSIPEPARVPEIDEIATAIEQIAYSHAPERKTHRKAEK